MDAILETENSSQLILNLLMSAFRTVRNTLILFLLIIQSVLFYYSCTNELKETHYP